MSKSCSGKRKKGGAWTNTVRYYSKSDKTCSTLPWPINNDWTSGRSREEGGKWLLENRGKGYVFLIDDHTLEYAMRLLIDWNEKILKIWVFKRPLFSWQLTQLFLNHQFVVVKTEKWWWSVEKNSKEIVIQRSNYFKGVLDYEDSERRKTPLRRVSSDIGQGTMKDLIEFLFKNDELNNIYRLDGSNCQHFAEKVFNAFAKRKLHNVTFGCDPSGNDINMDVDHRARDSLCVRAQYQPSPFVIAGIVRPNKLSDMFFGSHYVYPASDPIQTRVGGLGLRPTLKMYN